MEAKLQAEIKAGFEKIQGEMHTFKQENDARLKKIETKGTAGGDTEEKIDRHSKAIDELVEKLEKTQTAIQRAGQGAEHKEGPEVLEKKMKDIANRMYRRTATAEEKSFYAANIPAEVKTLSSGSDVDGGWFVRPEVSAKIVSKYFESSPLEQLADSIVIGSDAFEEAADWDEVSTEAAGETSAHASTDTMQFNMLRIPVHQLQAKPGITLKLLEDSGIDIESYLAQKVGDKFGRDRATSFILGTGTGTSGTNQAKGIMSYANADAYGSVEQVDSTVSASFAANDFISLQNTLLEPYQKNASWMMRRATCTEIRKLVDGNGRYLLSMEGNLVDGYKQILLGSPLYYAADIAAMAASSLSVVYGDFKQAYLIVNRLGMSVLRDPYSSDNHVVYKHRMRFGGGVRNYQALKIMALLA